MRVNTLIFRLLAVAVVLIALPVSMYAVTSQEMEEARAIAAKIYLRYANDGSDYLEKLSPKTMSELEGELKSKEIENLAVFKSVKVPTDYASWTKDDLVKYWSETFYTNPEVKVKAIWEARTKTREALQGLKIQDPTRGAAPVEEPVEGGNTLPDAVVDAAVEEVAEAKAAEAALDSLRDEMKPAEGKEDTSSNSNNGIYIVLLCVLVLLVVVLIIYAARMFKRQTDRDDDDQEEEDKPITAQPASNVNVTIATPAVHPTADASPRMSKEVESLKAENAELRRAIQEYKYQIECLKSQEQERRAQSAIPTRNAYSDTADATAYVAEQDTAEKTLYLGRVNEDGIFVRAEREFNAAHSLFKLVSTDGITGTFTVVDAPAVARRIIADTHTALAGSCDCDLNSAYGRSGVQTVRGGTAIFDRGRWRVLRRAQVTFV